MTPVGNTGETETTNTLWAVYRCDKIKRRGAPQNEVAISFHATAGEAMDAANREQRADRAHSFVVGLA